MEVWKDILGGYQVSNMGRVRSLKRNKMLAIRTDKLGYAYVHLTVNGKDVFNRVHRLVADEFVPNPGNKREVNHINGIKTDNRAENLEWCTRTENLSHAYKTGLRKNVRAVYCEETKRIFYSARNAAKEMNLHHHHIINCCKGKQKTTGGYHWRYVTR